MIDYSHGKIYAIRSHQTDLIYIGSTTQKLSYRMSQHRANNTPCLSSNEILKYDDAYIELIELYPCSCKEELNRREGEIIRNNEKCVNKQIAGRTQKEWVNDNRERDYNRKKEWTETNDGKVKEYMRQYREQHKERISQQKKDWYLKQKALSLVKE